MMKQNSVLRAWRLPLFVLGCLLFSYCSQEAIDSDEGFALFYSGISEICPSTHINIVPTWRGGTPTHFSISQVRFQGSSIQTDCFSVDPELGVFSITQSDLLQTGDYIIDIVCEFNGQRCEFPAAIEITMMKPIPDGIVVTPADLTASLSQILSTESGISLPTAQITTDGSNHVQIKNYLIANVYKDDELANDCKEWFEMSPEGVFSIVPDNSEFEAGVYTFDFKLTTYIVGANSEEGIFKNALKLNVTSAPTRLVYEPAAARIEQGVSGASPAPSVKGSKQGLKFAIKSVTHNNAVGITIDEQSGVLNFPQTTQSMLDSTYTVSVTVSNDYGAKDFQNVYAFTVIAFISPITQFTYDNIQELITGVSFSNPVTKMDGAEVTYSFVDLPAALSGLKIDEHTGTVSCAKGVELPIGPHTVSVQASNVKGSMQTSFTINVVANPNYFTYVRWGNNLGPDRKALLPLEKYGNQFRAYQGEPTLRMEVAESDIPKGAKVTYSQVRKTDNSSGFAINATTGRAEIYPKAVGGAVYPHVHYVSVTVGQGEAAITRTFPFFVDQCGPQNGYQIEYTPFVFRVNPKKGGVSAAPKITKADGTPFTGGAIDYNTNICFYNLYGPAEHTNDKRLNQDRNGFLKTVWDKYYKAINQSANYGVRYPMTYWDNVAKNQLPYTGGYFRPEDLSLVINPEKFVDDYGYANGVMTMITKFNSDGLNPNTTTANTTQVTRLIVWFDPDYTE